MSVTTAISPYLHILEGRIRIKIPEIKGTSQGALSLEQHLGQYEDIHAVTANPTTGNVLILFDSTALDHDDILTMIRQGGYLINPPVTPWPERNKLTHVVLQSAVEVAMEHLVLALI